MSEITVRGSARAQLPPTGAAVTVTVHVRGADTQAAAVSTCGARSAVVDAVVDRALGGLVRRAVTSSLRTGPEWVHTSGGRRELAGYAASRTTQLDCEPDGEGLTELLGDVSRYPEVEISGPRWEVAPDADGWVGVREAAAADARRRAEAYAAGLGVRVGVVRWVAEPGLRHDGHAEGGAVFAAAAVERGAGGDGEAVPVRIRPEPITVSASVEVAFALVG